MANARSGEKERARDARDLAILAAIDAGQTYVQIQRAFDVSPCVISNLKKGLCEAE